MRKEVAVKTCSHCRQTKPQSEFWRNKATVDGLQYECRDCRRAAYDSRKYRASRDKYFVPEETVEAIRRLLAMPRGGVDYRRPTRCAHGSFDGLCAECERAQRVGMVLGSVEEEDE